jgi:hypothetical protein
MVTGVLIGSRSGAYGVSVGFAIAMGLLVIPCLAYSLHGSPVTVANLVRAMGRPLASAAGAGAVLIAGRVVWMGSVPLAAGLGLSLAVFGAGYAALWLAIPGGRAAGSEIVRAVREVRRHRADAPPEDRPPHAGSIPTNHE